MNPWNNRLKKSLIALSYLLLFFYFYLAAFIATGSAGGRAFVAGWGGIHLLFWGLFVLPPLTAAVMGLLYWRLRAFSDCARTRDIVRILVALSILLALPLWPTAIVLPNGLWVEYSWKYGSHPYRGYGFLPITAVPLFGLLFTTYGGHVLLMQRKPRSFAWLVANHLPLLSVLALLLFVHERIPKPYFNG